MEACKETLDVLSNSQKVSADNLDSAKRVVVNRHEGEMRTTRYWTELMSGLQVRRWRGERSEHKEEEGFDDDI
jgi:hypothetical protein